MKKIFTLITFTLLFYLLVVTNSLSAEAKEYVLNDYTEMVAQYDDPSLYDNSNNAKKMSEENGVKQAIVDTSVARVFKYPDNNTELIDILPNGSVMNIFEEGKEWIGVIIDSNKRGYIHVSCLSLSLNLKTTEPISNMSIENNSRTIFALPSQSANIIKTPYDTLFSLASVKSGVPVNLLKAVAKNESAFNTDAVSSSGAVGIMQLMENTAKVFGCTERYDTKANIIAGSLYLASLITRYKDIELALAAYNAGPSNVDKYGGIPPFIETQRYVEKVMKTYQGLDIEDYVDKNSISAISLKSLDNPLIQMNSNIGSVVALYACQFVGNKYLWGGNDLENGIDCSGFVKEVYKIFGVELPRYSYSLRNSGTLVSGKDEFDESLTKPGDIICYEGHVAIYLGNNCIVHAAGKKEGIIISEKADYKEVVCVRRIF